MKAKDGVHGIPRLVKLLPLLLVGLCFFMLQTGKIVANGEKFMIADELEDDSNLFYKTNISFTNSQPERHDGDNSRWYKSSSGEAYFIYKAPNEITQSMTGFRMETWYQYNNASQIPGDMQFATSPDNVTYAPLSAYTKTIDTSITPVSGWRRYFWEVSSLPANTKYIKITFGDTSNHPSSWAIQVGRTTLELEVTVLQTLQQKIIEAETIKNNTVAGNEPGMVPQPFVDDLAAAIGAARTTADNANSTTSELETAYMHLAQSLDALEAARIYALNWPANAAITAADTGLNHIAVTWPHVAESGRTQNVTYHVYQNGAEAASVTSNTYTFHALKPQMPYQFSVVARSGPYESRLLGPVTLSTAQVPAVPAHGFSGMDPDDFADEDYISPEVWVDDPRGIPYYFYHFHTVANAVRLDPPNRGFIDIVVHRSPEKNKPYNARVQENHLWLTYFYTRQAPWNIYYGMPEVRMRLEAVLEHLLSLQNADGAFSVDTWEERNLPGTSFAAQYMGQTIRLLNEAKAANPDFPAIDAALYGRLVESYRKALVLVLNDNGFWNHGKQYTNQYTLVWSTAAAYLKYYPDVAIEQKMRQRFTAAANEFISPAGFYYEANALDMAYNLGVHMQNMISDYYYFKDTDLEQEMIETESKFIEWLRYNLVLEPDGSHFTSNSAPTSRTSSIHIKRKDIPLAEKVPMARAFVKTQEEVAAEIARAKQDLADGTMANIPPLQLTGENSYNPFALYNRIMYRYYPTEAERAAAISNLPYIASDRFNHQRVDSTSRSGLEFTYVRRPFYYAAFNAGKRTANTQAFGLGLIWHPEGGIMLSSQSESATATATRGLSWGTKSTSAVRVYESGGVNPTYTVAGQPLQPVVGHGDIAQGEVQMWYNLGTEGTKTVTFAENGLSVAVSHPSEFTEYIPLVIGAEDTVTVNDGVVTIVRGEAVMEIAFDGGAAAVTANVTPKNFYIFDYRMHLLTLKTSGALNYTITMSTVQ
ncbi:fibronectin type III domain-containing protein [Paenibacillus allorhizosphaerae]|uniref:Fibronectin type-III domain-containing protein n=1 Tax=Paenibacillus allorhizosphaerae TaxID=2849866 RepID=A0ABM8VMB4_9BACL|nr:fibronectin type III domain-containing protein [Paenibacillus allorhizosphaerae]CAG7649243.1 hypothetical protein PAECIP111802_04441 [Paenibacillus allorhizosphaerae]